MALQKRQTVLLVNKQPNEIVYLTRQLESAGFVISFVTTGTGAIKSVEEHAPDVVLLDVGLSDMDGLEVVKAIRGNPQRHSIPIIAIGAFPHLKSRFLDNGCDGYVHKPIKALDLISQIRRLTRK